MKRTLRNLWNHRGQNIWLFLELVVVSVVAWVVLDPVIVCRYLSRQSDGFDADRLVFLEATLPYKMEYGEKATDIRPKILTHAKMSLHRLEGVEHVYTVANYADPFGRTTKQGVHQNTIVLDNDTIDLQTFQLDKYVGLEFFDTYGIRAIEGDVSEDSLKANSPSHSIILSKSTAMGLFGRTDVVGKSINVLHKSRKGDRQYPLRVQAVVEDAKTNPYNGNPCYIYTFNYQNFEYTFWFILRLKEGVSMTKFLEDNSKVFSQSNLCGAEPFRNKMDIDRDSSLTEKKYRMNLLLSSFFLISVCLGTIGAFWKQMQRRTGEVGVMRAFGATRPRVMRMFLQEGFVLTTLAVLIGIGIYFNYAISHDFPTEDIYMGIEGLRPSGMAKPWYVNFSTHFTVVSILIYLLLLTVVSIGIAIPAWRASRTHIVDTLK